MGIGIVAVRGNDQVLATWAVKEYSTGNILMDTAVAIKLAMIKAREQQWRRIQVAITQRQLLKMIETKRATDIRFHSHLEHIYDLSSMFMECSFVLAREEVRNSLANLSFYALSIYFDEEWLNPQCRGHLYSEA